MIFEPCSSYSSFLTMDSLYIFKEETIEAPRKEAKLLSIFEGCVVNLTNVPDTNCFDNESFKLLK